MHLGRLHPTRDELTPGVAPLVSLLQARAGLLTDPEHHEKKLADTSNGEVATLMLPIDATTAIVTMPTRVVESDPKAMAPALDMVGVRLGNDALDSIAPKEFEAVYAAVAKKLGARR